MRLLQTFETLSLEWGPLGVSNPGFDFAFAIGIADTAGQSDRAVVRQHIAVQRVQRRIVDVGPEHALAEVVEHHHTHAAAQSPEGLLLQLRPDLCAGLKDQQPNRLAAVTERHHEQAGATVLARVRVTNHGPGAVIDLRFLARWRDDDGVRLRRPGAAQFPDIAFDAFIGSGETALIHQVLPDRHRVAALGESGFDQFVKRHAGTGGGAW